MHALLLTAGLGTRLRPYTFKLPKPSIPFLTVPLLGYALYYLERAGLTHLICNTHHLPHAIENTVNHLKSDHYTVSFSHEHPNILGGAGAIKNCQPLLETEDHFLLLNGDSPLIFDNPQIFEHVLNFHKSHDHLATMVFIPHPNAGDGVMRSTWINIDQQEVQSFGTHCDKKNLKAYHNIGIHILSKRVLDLIPKGEINLLYDVLLPEIQKGQTVGAYIDEQTLWYETGNIRDYVKATEDCVNLLSSNNKMKHSLKQIIDRFHPQNHIFINDSSLSLYAHKKDFSSELEVHRFAIIDENCDLSKINTLSSHILVTGSQPTQKELLEHNLIIR